MFRQSLLVFQFMPIASCSVTVSPSPLISELTDENPQAFSSPGWTSPALSFLHRRGAPALSSSWPSYEPALTGPRPCAGSLRPRCTTPSGAEQRGTVTSLGLLLPPLLLHLAFWAASMHWWLMLNFLSNRTTKSFSAGMLSRSSPSLYSCLALPWSGAIIYYLK